MTYREYQITVREAFTGFNYQIDTPGGTISNTGIDNEYGKFETARLAEVAAKQAVAAYIAATATTKAAEEDMRARPVAL